MLTVKPPMDYLKVAYRDRYSAPLTLGVSLGIQGEQLLLRRTLDSGTSCHPGRHVQQQLQQGCPALAKSLIQTQDNEVLMPPCTQTREPHSPCSGGSCPERRANQVMPGARCPALLVPVPKSMPAHPMGPA